MSNKLIIFTMLLSASLSTTFQLKEQSKYCNDWKQVYSYDTGKCEDKNDTLDPKLKEFY